jgi:hypothetical protein
MKGLNLGEEASQLLNVPSFGVDVVVTVLRVAEPPELIRLKCANHHPRGNPR